MTPQELRWLGWCFLSAILIFVSLFTPPPWFIPPAVAGVLVGYKAYRIVEEEDR
jgi:hypothetical protein